jgi:hypothetical protein
MNETTLEPLYIGSDFTYHLHVKSEDETESLDITGWSLSFMLKRRLEHLDAAALLTKTTPSGITIAGTFNADPDVNTQRATVVIADTETDPLTPGTIYWEFKRTDAGLETPLAGGPVELKRGVHRS